MSGKNKINTTQLFLIISFIVLVILTILSAQNPHFGDKFSIYNWFAGENYEDVSLSAALWFTFIACFVGALIPFPVPYALPITIFTGLWYETKNNAWGLIILIVLVGAIANTIGDFIDYLIGAGAEKLLSKDDPELSNRWAQKILNKPKSIPWIIALFGVSPLPDSLLLVPLGIVKYDKKKLLLWMFIGKVFMMILFALAGIYTLGWLDSLVEDSGSSDTGWIMGMGLLFLIWLMMFFMTRYKPKEE